MSESTVAKPEQTGEVVYRPISILALIGLGVSIIFTAIVFFSTLSSFLLGVPFFLPSFLMGLPVLGAILSLVAARRIRLSEGTMAGVVLTKWGLWLAVLSGLGYGAFYFGTWLAIRQQSNSFLMVKGEDSGFFPLLMEGKVNEAFLLSQPYNLRQGVDPNNRKAMAIRYDRSMGMRGKGELSSFRETDVVQALLQWGKDKAEVIPMGLKDWRFENGGYTVERNYRVRTPEIYLDVLIRTRSTDRDNPGLVRKWHVKLPIISTSSTKLTELGKKRRKIRSHAYDFFNKYWVESINSRKLSSFPKSTTNWGELSGVEPATKEKIRREVLRFFSEDQNAKLRLFPGKYMLNRWQEVDGHIQLIQLFTLLNPQNRSPEYVAEGKVIMRTERPYDMSSGDLHLPRWVVTSYEITRLQDIPKMDEK